LPTYIKDVNAAIQLGKALFWDMQVGNDSVQACESCHYRAGADPIKHAEDALSVRDTNELSERQGIFWERQQGGFFCPQ
jgi:cytochrome c peroxidase